MDVSENEIGLREARAQLGELVSKAQYSGVTTYITRHGRRVAAIVPIPQEQAMTVSLYETNSEILVIARGDNAWSLQIGGSHMVGKFADDAEAWINGDWEPNEGDGQTPTHLDGLTEVATWDKESGVTLLVRADSLGGAASEYLPARANPVIWSVVRGEAPYTQAVEPHQADVTVPASILNWAITHGFSEDDPDVYILVTPKDEAGEIPGEIAYMEGDIPADELARLREALAELDN